MSVSQTRTLREEQGSNVTCPRFHSRKTPEQRLKPGTLRPPHSELPTALRRLGAQQPQGIHSLPFPLPTILHVALAQMLRVGNGKRVGKLCGCQPGPWGG